MSEDDSDRNAIIDLIHRTIVAMWTNDFDLWDSCFLDAPYTTKWGWWRGGGTYVRRGGANLAARRRIDHPPRVLEYAYKTRVEDLSLQIINGMAWATFVQQQPDGPEFDGHVGPGRRYELRIFEKVGGEWKIVLVGTLDNDAGPAGTAMLHLDPEGRVLWASQGAHDLLASDDDLVVRGGILRFRERLLDRRLGETLVWAAKTVDAGYSSTHGARPIVVEAGEGLPTKVYWITADAGLITFSFPARQLDDRRLSLAAAVYGLSPMQQRLAALVVEGLALTDIAAKMGITTNTARTHLSRVFDKVGVRTQSALVRVLLTAIAPV